ncbi:MAG: glycoside hydrolase family 38 C-terminal domain-containing protein [Lentisphaeria bacterium]
MSTPQTITVHMIGNAHLDPVWLWNWQAGLDEALATCRTACDLLDRYPDFIFTRGEAWAYQQVQRLDPELFARIKKHIAGGRWEVAGGWWLQPDCNLPGSDGFERQIALGKRYFLQELGQFPEYGYNVDSFGHAATLPGRMRAAGQRYYVMMRPQESERALPARLFRWRGYADGPEVVTFRIAGAYTFGNALAETNIRQACTELPEGVTETMCFYGVGDHGGGPTAALIEWIREHRDAFPGCRLVFSSPARYFAAVQAQAAQFPLVTGELQHHAIGCYSVVRSVKAGVRQTEHLLRQAEIMSGAEAGADSAAGQQLEEAWRQVAFVHFHDIFGGTCVPSAYPKIQARLGAAQQTAEELLQLTFRDRLRALPGEPRQRVVIGNAADRPFDGWIEFEPWTQWRQWEPQWNLLDAGNRPVPFQVLPAESVNGNIPRLLFRAQAAAGGLAVFKIATDGPAPVAGTPLAAGTDAVGQPAGASLRLGPAGAMSVAGADWPLPRLALIEDRSDNWSHGIDRFPEGPVASAVWDDPCIMVQGPLRASLAQSGRIGDSRLRAEWRIHAGEPVVELRLTVHWVERLKLLKLVWPLAGAPAGREDGISGGSLLRDNDGKERPLREWTLVAGAAPCGVVCPDVFALDGTPARLRFTLLRSAIMTHHEPSHGAALNAVPSDQGVHEFRFRFHLGAETTAARLEQDALMQQQPPVVADLTRGMPCRMGM